jgi:hypothetical protein
MDQKPTLEIGQDVINGFSLAFTTKLYEKACKLADDAGILLFICDDPSNPDQYHNNNYPLKPLARGVMWHICDQTKCFDYDYSNNMSFNDWMEMVNATRDFLNMLK